MGVKVGGGEVRRCERIRDIFYSDSGEDISYAQAIFVAAGNIDIYLKVDDEGKGRSWGERERERKTSKAGKKY